MPEMQDLTLQNVAGGALPEKFQRALAEVLENIRDPNTKATKQRKITMEVKLKPEETREEASVSTQVKTSLAPDKPDEGTVYLGRRDGELTAVAFDPRQEDMFDDGKNREGVTPLPTADEGGS